MVSPGLPDELIAGCAFSAAPDVATALNTALSRHGDDARVAVMTHGAETLPALERLPAGE